MSNIVPMTFDKKLFPFTNECWVNATIAAKYHGKLTKDWLKSESTRSYISEVAEELDIDAFNSKEEISPLLVRIEKGRHGGTWIHPELVIEFARWLSPKFARACDRHIKNMLVSQNATLTNEQIINLLTYQDPTNWEKRFKEPYYRALSKMTGLPYFGHVGGCPALFGQITSRWVYGVALPYQVYEVARGAAKESGDKIHQFLKPEALKLVEDQLIAVAQQALGSTDYKDFEARCMLVFPARGQMKLLYAA